MKVALSFTGVLYGVFKGLINLDEIDMIIVGCSKEHLPSPESDALPCEVAWIRKAEQKPIPLTQRGNDHLISKAILYPEGIEAYKKVWKRMTEVPVFTTKENYWDVGSWLLKGTDMGDHIEQIFLNGEWWDLKKFSESHPEENPCFDSDRVTPIHIGK